jgi:uncharacterized protein (TIGR00369 family)
MAGEAIQALGGNGYTNEYPTGRLWRDAKLYEIGAGTSEIRRMLIGRELSVHGGWQATLLDSCMACAVQTQLEAGQAFTSLEIKVNFLRALTDKVGPVRAEGRVIQVGRQIGIAEGSLYDAAGKLYAHGTTTCLIFDHENLRRK